MLMFKGMIASIVLLTTLTYTVVSAKAEGCMTPTQYIEQSEKLENRIFAHTKNALEISYLNTAYIMVTMDPDDWSNKYDEAIVTLVGDRLVVISRFKNSCFVPQSEKLISLQQWDHIAIISLFIKMNEEKKASSMPK